MGEWKPISSAPKDGTLVLLWVPGGGWYTGQWNPLSGHWDDGDYFSELDATHWTELPPPPKD